MLKLISIISLKFKKELNVAEKNFGMTLDLLKNKKKNHKFCVGYDHQTKQESLATQLWLNLTWKLKLAWPLAQPGDFLQDQGPPIVP